MKIAGFPRLPDAAKGDLVCNRRCDFAASARSDPLNKEQGLQQAQKGRHRRPMLRCDFSQGRAAPRAHEFLNEAVPAASFAAGDKKGHPVRQTRVANAGDSL